MLPYLSRKFQENKTYKISLGYIAILANMQNLSIWHIPLPFPKYLKRFPNYQPMVMVGWYSQQAFQIYQSIKFGVGVVPQFNCFTNVLLIGISLPLIKIQTKYFKNTKQIVCWACTFHKLSISITFRNFGNVLVPQLIELLQVLIIKQKNR